MEKSEKAELLVSEAVEPSVTAEFQGARRVRLSRELSLYVIRGVFVYACVSFLILEAVWGTILTVRVTEEFNLDFLIIFPVLLAALGESLSYTMPIALLFGSALAVGRLRAERELLAISSFGVAPRQLLTAVGFLGVVFAMFLYEANQRWVPRCRAQTRNIVPFMLDQLPYLGEGWNLDFRVGSHVLWVYRHEGPLMEGIFLTSVPRGDDTTTPISQQALEEVDALTYPFCIFAERAWIGRRSQEDDSYDLRFEGVTLFLDEDFFGQSQVESDFMQRGHMSSFSWALPVERRDGKAKDKTRDVLLEERPRLYDAWQLHEERGTDGAKRARRKYFENVGEPHRRLAIALSCLTFPMTAFAIGLFLTSNNRLAPFFWASTLVPGVFYGFELTTGKWALEGGIMPWLTLQLGNISLIVLTAILYRLMIRGPKR